jgi:hypothetical protein
VPHIRVAMSEHDRDHAVARHDTARFGEGSGNHLVVVFGGAVVHITATFYDCFLVFFLDAIGVGGEGKPRSRSNQSTLEPYEEQVGRIRVVDHVVVRRIGDYRGHRFVAQGGSNGRSTVDVRWLAHRPTRLVAEYRDGVIGKGRPGTGAAAKASCYPVVCWGQG